MRSFHRWIMTVFVLLLFYWAASGLLLNLYDLLDPRATFAREGGGVGSVAPRNVMGVDVDAATALTEADLAPMLSAAVNAAQSAAPGSRIAAIQLHIDAAGPRATLRLAGPGPRQLLIDTGSGEILTPAVVASAAAVAPNLHALIKRWHRGLMLGTTGAVLSFVSGCALILLCLSGIVLYLDVWRARRRLGRARFFWA